MDIVSGISAASNAISIAKAMRDAEKNFDAAVYKGQVADLTVSLADAKMALVDAKEALIEKNAEIDRLSAQFAEQSVLVQGRGGFQYKADAAGNPIGYPVCPTCIARDHQTVKLVQDGHFRSGMCPRCHTKFSQVTSYLPKIAGGPETAEEAEAQKQNEAIRRVTDRARGPGNPFY